MNRRRHSNSRGFTLIEVLVTLLFMAIAIPAIMGGISSATRIAGSTRRRSEATGLAESELNQIVASGSWQAGNSAGDFSAISPDFSDYTWQSNVTPWAQDTTGQQIQQIDLIVSWKGPNGNPQTLTLSTLAYVRAQITTTTQ
jgi:prepilin-type N-terminal cleavage/methylation domain-containing protein